MTATGKRVAIMTALLFATVVAFAYGVPDGVAAALPMVDTGPAGSVIWD